MSLSQCGAITIWVVSLLLAIAISLTAFSGKLLRQVAQWRQKRDADTFLLNMNAFVLWFHKSWANASLAITILGVIIVDFVVNFLKVPRLPLFVVHLPLCITLIGALPLARWRSGTKDKKMHKWYAWTAVAAAYGVIITGDVIAAMALWSWH